MPLLVPHIEAFPRPEEVLDHRPPHLWLDGVLDAEAGVSASGLWLPGDEHFDGHFDGMPILPAVKQLEALAQLTAYTVLLDLGPTQFGVFKAVSGAKFSRPVKPGELLQLSILIVEREKRDFRALGVASVSGKVACSGILIGTSMPKTIAKRMFGSKKESKT